MVDIEDIPTPLKELSDADFAKLENIVACFIKEKIQTKRQFAKFRREMQRKHKICFQNAQLLFVYRTMLANGSLSLHSSNFEKIVKSREVRGTSGVTVFTLLTSPFPETGEFLPKDVYDPSLPTDKAKVDYREVNPETGEKRQPFSCPYNCYYCPDETRANGAEDDMPRSYLKLEPAVARAFRNNFDTVNQIRDRARAYVVNGIDIDKVEVIIEGGTYTSYPEHYRIKLMQTIFYAFNTLFDKEFLTNPRKITSLENEIILNETAQTRVIGITVETRPDCITPENLIEFRRCGVTRVQIGLQHTDDKILKKINRKCTTSDAIASIKLMKDCGFKIDIHLMPDLPNSSYSKDIEMFDRINTDPDLDIDQLKIYPTSTVPWTVIEKWYKKGRYKPYAESMVEMEVESYVTDADGDGINETPKIVWVKKLVNPLIEAIIHYKKTMPNHRRNNRIQRDIPSTYIMGGSNKSNLRQLIHDEMRKRGLKCRCIRCREVRNRETDISKSTLFSKEFPASLGREFFISFASPDENILYGFIRLRLTETPGMSPEGVVFPELEGCALIRELHVYGKMQKVTTNSVATSTEADTVQHYGFGTRLLQEAEKVAKGNGYRKIAVISGVGVRGYYRKRGYKDDGHYLIKVVE